MGLPKSKNQVGLGNSLMNDRFGKGKKSNMHRGGTAPVKGRRQEYLFSRIVTVYGGSQQMQLDTIAKQILRLP